MIERKDLQSDRNWMGVFPECRCYYPSLIDGRFLISKTDVCFTLTDLFHTKTRELKIDVSPRKSGIFRRSFYVLNLNTILLVFGNDNSPYLGIGEIDLERSMMVVKQAVTLPIGCHKYEWYPTSHPPNLHEGFILASSSLLEIPDYFIVKMGTDNRLRVSKLAVPRAMKAVACFDGFLYGLYYDRNSDNDSGRSLDLVKFSISTGKSVREKTTNQAIVSSPFHVSIISLNSNNPILCCSLMHVDSQLICVASEGPFFYRSYFEQSGKCKIISLDLDTKEWKQAAFDFTHSVRSISSDGERMLVVWTKSDYADEFNVYRLVFNRNIFSQPDKLCDLAWLRLKRIFDALPSSYDFILSQLPANFKQKCPISQP
ncbi:hypothetical protein M3Y98_00590500 [Aphelenchoides besseyi]|nr:hypothetical protein M3Y98_00590500 [Aphelenchoides besseyi]